MLGGALAAALTPLKDAGEALDEVAIGPYVDFLQAGRADAVLRVRVRRTERLRRAAAGPRAAARRGTELPRVEGLRYAVGTVRAVPARRPGRLRRSGGADPAGSRERRRGRRVSARLRL